MDPLSAASAISSLCFTSGKLLLGFFEYIRDVQDVPSHISALTSELCALNTALMGLKTLMATREDGRAQQTVLLALARDSAIALDNCKETMQQIETMVQKSKIKTRQSANGQLIKCTKWLWNKKEIELLTAKVESWKATISLMLQISSGHGQDEAAALLDKIHKSVEKLESDREHVKETLVVMDQDHRHFDDAEFSVTIKPVSQSPASGPPPSPSPFRPFNQKLIDRLENGSRTQAKLQCKSAPWSGIPSLFGCQIKPIIARNRKARLDIGLSDTGRNSLRALFPLTLGDLARHGVNTYMPPELYGSAHDVLRVLPQPSSETGGTLPAFLIPARGSGTALLDFGFCTITRERCVVGVRPGQSIASQHGNSEVEFTFDIEEDAEHVFHLLKDVQTEVESSWALHVRAFANLDAAAAEAQGEDELRAMAAREYARSWRF